MIKAQVDAGRCARVGVREQRMWWTERVNEPSSGSAHARGGNGTGPIDPPRQHCSLSHQQNMSKQKQQSEAGELLAFELPCPEVGLLTAACSARSEIRAAFQTKSNEIQGLVNVSQTSTSDQQGRQLTSPLVRPRRRLASSSARPRSTRECRPDRPRTFPAPRAPSLLSPPAH